MERIWISLVDIIGVFVIPLLAVVLTIVIVRSKHPGSMIRQTTTHPMVISINDAFETETAPIWETQMPILQLICAKRQGVTVLNLEEIFERCKRSYPEVFECTVLEDWLLFYENAELVSISGGTVSLTTTGREFMATRVVVENASARM